MKYKDNIIKILPYIVAFICGVIFILILFKIGSVREASAYTEVSPIIAIVNQDVVDSEYSFSFGDKIVSMFEDNDTYNFISTSYQDAEEGVKGYAYSGYILIDSEFTDSMYSINREIPSKGQVSYKINSNLEDNDSKSVEDYILSQLYLVNNNINYLYISSILEVLHGSQENVEDVLTNESEVDRILGNINEYNEKYYEESKDFLKELAKNKDEGTKGNSEDGVSELIEIDPSGWLNLGFDAAEIKSMVESIEENYTGNLEDLVAEFERIFSSYGKLILSDNINVENITADDVYVELLNGGINKLGNINTVIEKFHDAFVYLDRLDLTQYVYVFEFFDQMYLNATQGNIVEFHAQIDNTKFQKLVTFITDFNTDYQYWSNHYDGECYNDTVVPATGDPNNCMKPFIDKYKDSNFIKTYLVVEKVYKRGVDFVGSNVYSYITGKYDNYVVSLGGAYIDFKSKAPFTSLSEAYSATNDICLNLGYDESNILTNFVCNWENFINVFGIEYIENKKIGDENLVNNVVSQDVEVVKAVGNHENDMLNNYVAKAPNFANRVIGSVNQVFSEDKIQSAEDKLNGMQATNDSLQDANDGLQQRIEDNKEANQEEINKVTKQFKETYPELTSNIDANSDLLYEFATLFENSKNAENANYYLYDFVSNPVAVNKEDSSDRLIPIDRTNMDKNKVATMAALTLTLAVSSGIYVDIRRRYKHGGRGKSKREVNSYEI